MTIIEVPLSCDIKEPKKRKTLLEWMRWIIFGAPIANIDAGDSLLSKFFALPVLCSDAISSVAYGGQQVLLALCAAGLWMPQHQALYANYTMEISWAILILLVIVSASYRQTIFGYPSGGGSYIVSKENLGETPGLIAAAALMIDYVLTVSVSVASGMQNLKDVPLFTSLQIGNHLEAYCLGAILLIVVLNLRGLKESANLMAGPVYVFIAMLTLMVVLGLIGPLVGWSFHPEFVNQVVPATDGGTQQAFHAFGMVVLLRAFANGCSAMTGIESVSNGIPAFKEPKTRNAAATLVWMAVILGTLFMGATWLSVKFHVVYWEHGGISAPAVIDQLSGMIFGKEGAWSWAYLVTQLSTALILIIAAQTSFSGFPRLASILAGDGYLPRQLMNVGDKLAFNNGIIVLGLFSSLFIILEHGSVDLLIPFFAIGVFMAFTMSQSGMVRHWFSLKGPGWRQRALVNGLGALASFVVVIDIAAEKFLDGAWLVLVVTGFLLFFFKKVHRHYATIAQQLSLASYHRPVESMKNTVLVLVPALHGGTLNALEYARSISSDCQAVYVATDPEKTERMKEAWEHVVPDLPLVILDSPYRSLLVPIMRYIDEVHEERPNHRITVVIGEFVPEHWWDNFLHGNTGLLLKLALLGRRDVIVINVRYWLDEHRTQEAIPASKPSA